MDESICFKESSCKYYPTCLWRYEFSLFVADPFSQLTHLHHERNVSLVPDSWSGRYWEVQFWYQSHTKWRGRFLNAQASWSVPRPRQKLLWCWPAWEFARWHHLEGPLTQLGQVAKTGAICLLEKNPVSVEDLRRGLGVCLTVVFTEITLSIGQAYWNMAGEEGQELQELTLWSHSLAHPHGVCDLSFQKLEKPQTKHNGHQATQEASPLSEYCEHF